jgi:hypothetical protein
VLENGAREKPSLLLKNTKTLAEVIVIDQQMIDGHMLDCAIHEEGPCTCGTEEELEAIAREEAGE